MYTNTIFFLVTFQVLFPSSTKTNIFIADKGFAPPPLAEECFFGWLLLGLSFPPSIRIVFAHHVGVDNGMEICSLYDLLLLFGKDLRLNFECQRRQIRFSASKICVEGGHLEKQVYSGLGINMLSRRDLNWNVENI